MIDNGLPLPDNDLSTDPNISYDYGLYCKVKYCSKCGYFLTPNQLDLSGGCCPNCGVEPFDEIVGRYQIALVKRGWFKKSTDRQIIGFTPKLDEASRESINRKKPCKIYEQLKKARQL